MQDGRLRQSVAKSSVVERNEEFVRAREQKLWQLMEEHQQQDIAECTFAPQITQRAKRTQSKVSQLIGDRRSSSPQRQRREQQGSRPAGGNRDSLTSARPSVSTSMSTSVADASLTLSAAGSPEIAPREASVVMTPPTSALSFMQGATLSSHRPPLPPSSAPPPPPGGAVSVSSSVVGDSGAPQRAAGVGVGASAADAATAADAGAAAIAVAVATIAGGAVGAARGAGDSGDTSLLSSSRSASPPRRPRPPRTGVELRVAIPGDRVPSPDERLAERARREEAKFKERLEFARIKAEERKHVPHVTGENFRGRITVPKPFAFHASDRADVLATRRKLKYSVGGAKALDHALAARGDLATSSETLVATSPTSPSGGGSGAFNGVDVPAATAAQPVGVVGGAWSKYAPLVRVQIGVHRQPRLESPTAAAAGSQRVPSSSPSASASASPPRVPRRLQGSQQPHAGAVADRSLSAQRRRADAGGDDEPAESLDATLQRVAAIQRGAAAFVAAAEPLSQTSVVADIVRHSVGPGRRQQPQQAARHSSRSRSRGDGRHRGDYGDGGDDVDVDGVDDAPHRRGNGVDTRRRSRHDHRQRERDDDEDYERERLRDEDVDDREYDDGADAGASARRGRHSRGARRASRRVPVVEARVESPTDGGSSSGLRAERSSNGSRLDVDLDAQMNESVDAPLVRGSRLSALMTSLAATILSHNEQRRKQRVSDGDGGGAGSSTAPDGGGGRGGSSGDGGNGAAPSTRNRLLFSSLADALATTPVARDDTPVAAAPPPPPAPAPLSAAPPPRSTQQRASSVRWSDASAGPTDASASNGNGNSNGNGVGSGSSSGGVNGSSGVHMLNGVAGTGSGRTAVKHNGVGAGGGPASASAVGGAPSVPSTPPHVLAPRPSGPPPPLPSSTATLTIAAAATSSVSSLSSVQPERRATTGPGVAFAAASTPPLPLPSSGLSVVSSASSSVRRGTAPPQSSASTSALHLPSSMAIAPVRSPVGSMSTVDVGRPVTPPRASPAAADRDRGPIAPRDATQRTVFWQPTAAQVLAVPGTVAAAGAAGTAAVAGPRAGAAAGGGARASASAPASTSAPAGAPPPPAPTSSLSALRSVLGNGYGNGSAAAAGGRAAAPGPVVGVGADLGTKKEPWDLRANIDTLQALMASLRVDLAKM